MARADLSRPSPEVTLRPAGRDDFAEWDELFEAVAAEGRWIRRETPVDLEAASRHFARFFGRAEPAIMLLADNDGSLVGEVGVLMERGVGTLGMMVAAGWRGRGVGSTLIEAAIEWARDVGAHKLAPTVRPHNVAARRRSGELWDAIDMGLVLAETAETR